jgi:uncharacterized protein (DUF362 family)
LNVSIAQALGTTYPEPRDGFSPAERLPEYRLGAPSSLPNAVYAGVRRLFAQLGLDRERYGTPAWNPLGAYVRPGSSVFVLCNFVYHRRPQESACAFQAKCVHGSVLRALVDYVAIALDGRGTLRLGNAPLQSCSWERVLRDTQADRVLAFLEERGRPARALDLRLYVTDRSPLGRVRSVERRDDSDAVVVDLGRDSLLSELCGGGRQPRFRVADYDPARIESFHAGASHRYAVHRAILDSDVVISLPKLKTHEKVGITCALKGFVGAAAHKDCLAHHRLGSPRQGGDEYPDRQRWLRPASSLHDWINRRPGDARLQGLLQIGDRTLRRALRRSRLTTAGAWHGNDTCWRMAVDLARIAHYADRAGAMHETRQRRHLVLIDGIVAGEGQGPLAPSPVDAGALLFADDVVLADRLACRLMGFDPGSLPIVDRAEREMRWPLRAPGAPPPTIVLDGRTVGEAEVPAVLGRSFRPARGWEALLPRAS